jgi:hypothetical protein
MYKRLLAVQNPIVYLFYRGIFVSWNYFLNLFRPNTPRPTKPVPSNISVAGSGTGEGLPPLPVIGTVLPLSPIVDVPFVSADGFETKVDGVYVGGLSFCGQPAIPKSIITTHETINNFFIFFPFLMKRYI